MPRFNFSKFVSKHSLADLGAFEDLNPQADWEAGQNRNSTTQSIKGLRSISSSQLEDTLNDEIDALARQLDGDDGQLGTLAKSYADSPAITRSPTLSTGSRRKKQKPVGRALEDSGFSSFTNLEIDQSQIQGSDEMFISEEFFTAQDSSPKTSTPRSPRSSAVKDRPIDDHREQSRRNDDLLFEEDEYVPQISNPPPGAPDHVGASFGNGLVMVLDGDNKVQAVSKEQELQDFLQSKAGTENKTEVTRALDYFRNLPVEKIHHFSNTGEYMKYLQSNTKLCDVEIKIGDEKISAHKVALSCYSEYFADLFFKKTGKQTVPTSIRMSGVSTEVFSAFLEFVYTGELNVTSEILTELVALSDELTIPLLKQRCLDVLDDLPLEKSIQSLKDKKLSPSSDLFQFAISRISEEFSQVYQKEVFFDLDVVTICLILSHDDLQISSEIDVFRVALKWVAYSLNERRRYLSRVMKCVRYPYMTQKELFECFEITDLLRECPDMRKIILHANWIITAKMLGREDPLNCPVVRPRTCFTDKLQLKKKSSVFFSSHSIQGLRVDVDPYQSTPDNSNKDGTKDRKTKSNAIQRYGDIIAVGGFLQYRRASDNKQVKLVERYNSASNQWSHYSNLPESRFHHAATVLNGKMYLIGGSDPKKGRKTAVPTNDAYFYNVDENRWMKIESMNTPRMHHVVCSLFGLIYAIGGEDDKGRVLSSVECYSPMTNKWFYVKSMVTPRVGAGAATLDGKIVVVGGYGEIAKLKSGLPVLSSVEVFDPKNNSWKSKSDLRFPRCYANLVNVQENLYLCGGATRSFTTNDSVLTSVSSLDVYNKDQDVWEHKSSLIIARHFAGCSAIGGKIYIIGGVSTEANKILQSIECYDTINEVWISGIQELPFPARWLSCVTLPGRP